MKIDFNQIIETFKKTFIKGYNGYLESHRKNKTPTTLVIAGEFFKELFVLDYDLMTITLVDKDGVIVTYNRNAILYFNATSQEKKEERESERNATQSGDES